MLREYIAYGRKHGYWRRGIAYKFQCRHQIFRGVRLRGKRALDIGCGNGRFSIWAAIHGAREVLGLEPTLEGSTSDTVARFRDSVEKLSLSNIDIREETFQEFDSPTDHWDVIIMIASVNHLSEQACITLRESEESRREYMEIFQKLYSVTAPGGKVIITDCSSENKYAGRDQANPYASTIEWEKHQPPEIWSDLLQRAGFVKPRIKWIPPAQYLHFGMIFLSNYFYAYRRGSRFRLEVTRPDLG